MLLLASEVLVAKVNQVGLFVLSFFATASKYFLVLIQRSACTTGEPVSQSVCCCSVRQASVHDDATQNDFLFSDFFVLSSDILV